MLFWEREHPSPCRRFTKIAFLVCDFDHPFLFLPRGLELGCQTVACFKPSGTCWGGLDGREAEALEKLRACLKQRQRRGMVWRRGRWARDGGRKLHLRRRPQTWGGRSLASWSEGAEKPVLWPAFSGHRRAAVDRRTGLYMSDMAVSGRSVDRPIQIQES